MAAMFLDSPISYYATLMLSLFETFVFGGIFSGWASLVYVLREEGYFSHLCHQNHSITLTNGISTAICDAQDAELNLVYTVGTAASFLAYLPTGYALDVIGTRFTRILSHFTLVLGLMLVLISDPSIPYLLFPGLVCMAIGGDALFLTVIQTGNLFNKHRSTVMTLIAGVGDGSTIISLFLKLAHDQGISLDISFAVLISLSMFIFINTFCFLPKNRIPWPLPRPCSQDGNVVDDSAQPHLELDTSISKTSVNEDTRKGFATSRSRDFPTIQTCLTSPAFLLICFWFSVIALQTDFYIGTFNPYMIHKTRGNSRQVAHFTNVFGYFLFSSMFLTPFSGLILDRNKGKTNRQPYDDVADSALAFAVTTGLAILFSVCNMVPHPQAQYLVFCLYVIVYTFLYAMLFAVIAIIFPDKYYGTLCGVANIAGGVTHLLQYPLFLITQNYFNNNFLMMNIALLVACMSTLVLPVYLVIHARKKNNEILEITKKKSISIRHIF